MGALQITFDGFSLDPDSLKHVLKVIFEDEDEEVFESKCRALFALDTDKNDLIDALECLATVASASRHEAATEADLRV